MNKYKYPRVTKSLANASKSRFTRCRQASMNPTRNSCLNSPVIPKSSAKKGKMSAPLNPRNDQAIP